MTRSEVIAKLSREGYVANVGRIRQALRNGYVQPLPRRTARGAFDFQPKHLRQLRSYMVHVRPGPLPLAAVSMPIQGSNDRVRRLEREKSQLAERRAVRLEQQRQQKAADATIRWLEGIKSQLAD